MLFKHNRRYYNVLQGGMDVVPSFPNSCDVLLGTPGGLLDLFLHDTESPNSNISQNSWTTTTSFVSRKCMERTSFFKLSRCWLRDFDSLDNENAGGSAICIHRDLLPEGAIVTHVVTCQGRDHLVNIRSWLHNLVIVNVHFEPELTLRQFRGRLSIIHLHWPACPVEWALFWAIFNICDPEEGRFNVWNQSFTDGDPGKTAVFHSFFPYVLEIAQSDYTRRDSSAVGNIRTLSRIDRIFINLPMAEARDFHCSSHVVENLGKKQIPSDHAAVRLVIQKPTSRRHQSKHIPSWMSEHSIFVSILQQLHDDHRFSPDPFCALAEFKVLLHKSQEDDET